MRNIAFLFKQTLCCAAVLVAAASCTSRETPLEPVGTRLPEGNILPGTASVESPDRVVAAYYSYKNALTAIKSGDDTAPASFLAQQKNSAMSTTVRNEWLKSLGKRGIWPIFREQYALLPAALRDTETECYAATVGLPAASDLIERVLWETGRQPEGCNRLLQQTAATGKLDNKKAWRRVRGLLAANQITDARNLAQALGSPLPNPLSSTSGNTQGGQEALLYQVISREGRNSSAAEGRLQALSSQLTPEQTGFAYGQLGLTRAYSQDMQTALADFDRADRNQLSSDMWEWYARAALRLQRWSKLGDVIRAMPEALRREPVWTYWLARSEAAAGKTAEADRLYHRAAESGRNFYALLALEALGKKVDTRNNTGTGSNHDIRKVESDGNIARAMALFHASQNGGDTGMRRQAQQEWRYAVRDYNEDTLLASSALAERNGFYEMGIYSADRTNRKLNFNLRYLSPFKDLVLPHAARAGVDPAWVYGLARQESRFMSAAQSGVGAVGLMQVMPATAREIAGKLGMDNAELHTPEGNIRMGTWYLGDIRNRLGSEVLATAGYNAGPSRARRWQSSVPLEGAVYAETIPFDETRTYVKNVLANATYYASLFDEPQTSLTRRLGTIPAR